MGFPREGDNNAQHARTCYALTRDEVQLGSSWWGYLRRRCGRTILLESVILSAEKTSWEGCHLTAMYFVHITHVYTTTDVSHYLPFYDSHCSTSTFVASRVIVFLSVLSVSHKAGPSGWPTLGAFCYKHSPSIAANAFSIHTRQVRFEP